MMTKSLTGKDLMLMCGCANGEAHKFICIFAHLHIRTLTNVAQHRP